MQVESQLASVVSSALYTLWTASRSADERHHALPCVQVELSVRVATLLLRLHQQQLLAAPTARATLVRLHSVLHGQVRGLKNVLGFNIAAMEHLQRSLKERSAAADDADPDQYAVPVKRMRTVPDTSVAA